MERNLTTYTCSRCGTAFPITTQHTEIVRRDFVNTPQPPCLERLCAECWKAYIEEFLGRDFDGGLDESELTQSE
ncbi:small CPxCG-related zinc finger protein (plasmid) [Haloferax volcanii DS2]|uniref:Small CPxCG-related zinc finger protein n=1 Tax=Haloferax volcanii (strain ATCC 29605 / DSM 3757 / JCM 8879 / NBRC 14742 / NCIMB 2012 / VKM B-1768 / DS2) TaxID=309800 RepID=D4GQ72_HALVD|nr:small CPxCG-related zinc finger protein [Haloferax volcanii DS2]